MKKRKKTENSGIWAKKKKENLNIIEQAIKESIFTEDDLRDLLAGSWADYDFLEQSHDALLETMRDYAKAVNIFSADKKQITNEGRAYLLNLFKKSDNKAAAAILKGIKLQKSAAARKFANALHNKPGGSREKQAEIRKVWASGKYSSRDKCAEQECEALGMSFSAARKALRNTPPPT